MPGFRVETPQRAYDAIVERGSLTRVVEFLPQRAGKIFVVTTADVWELHRAKVEGRADDTREAITERMHEYRHLTEKVLEHYRAAGVKLHEIDGLGPVDEVFDRIQTALKGVR